MKTRIIKVQQRDGSPSEAVLGRWAAEDGENKIGNTQRRENATSTSKNLNSWQVPSPADTTDPSAAADLTALEEAGAYLRTSDIPVAFPTETVYGLGADATRSGAVKGIYAAKGRPSDNPLIVHVCDLDMLRSFLLPRGETINGSSSSEPQGETIPQIYLPLIERLWPGPLTILLPNPQLSKLAPEVTAGLGTFGCRMPASALARTLIKLAGAPLAAPSANASTKPSPTAAQHVLDDLEGRIELILDGGACDVGVESTVVDGMCQPPVVLRPGGVSIEALRACPGWEAVEKAYKDQAEMGAKTAPRAPGMKYKHYSPKARVVLYEAGFEGGKSGVLEEDLDKALEGCVGHEGREKAIAVIRTKQWPVAAGMRSVGLGQDSRVQGSDEDDNAGLGTTSFFVRQGALLSANGETTAARLLDVDLGQDIKRVAHGLFAALRELDRLGADVIFVEGVSDGDDIAAAVMNRLRKAASDIRA
ncbi:DHBP synthase RibB-like alpha/beta domain-containing protein [Podospora appendiculata]|uniref:Threonylcarbamoyl-AMP synthase n=1 Tax=Podospora appendiculata TaxID=314037 RepID=A0AAE0XJY4_9PEZI|nr:DHBP synthase RibB-like alpha/beta domain-containing protein [Podospora appendiculata]